MRLILAILVIIYLVGVGVELAPVIDAKWNTATAGETTSAVVDALPSALAWPIHAYHHYVDEDRAAPK